MNKSSTAKLEALKQAQQRQAQKTMDDASKTLVSGHHLIHLLKDVHPYFLSKSPLTHKLCGILPVPAVKEHHYHTIEAGSQRVSLVYLSKRVSRDILNGSYDSKIEFFNYYLDKNPVALVFLGCDDGHIVRVFPTEEKALQALHGMTNFEELYPWDLYQKKDVLHLLKTESFEDVESVMGKYLFYLN